MSITRDSLIGLGIVVVSIVGRYLFTQVILAQLYKYTASWLAKHPVHVALFLHYRNRHQTKDPHLCDEGQCKAIKY